MRPTSIDVAPKIAEIFKKHAAGCCLHVQIEDGNLEDHFFEDGSWIEHELCREVFGLLKQMKRTARKKACQKAREMGQ